MDDTLYRAKYFYETYYSNRVINKALCSYNSKVSELLKNNQPFSKDVLYILYIASNLIMRKEETVEQISNKYELKINKKLVDGMIMQISSSYNENGEFVIGNVKFKDPIDFINTLRNKFAHGNYYYLPDYKCIIMKVNDKEMLIPLEWLIKFNRLIFVEISKEKNDGHYYEGILKIKKNSFSQIKSYNNFKRSFTNLKYYEFIITPKNENTKYEAYENGIISALIRNVCGDFDNQKNPDGNIRLLKKYCDSESLNLDVNIIPVSNFTEEEKDQLKNIYQNTPDFNDLDIATQIQTLGEWIMDIKVTPNTTDHISQGYAITQNFIDYIDCDKSYATFAKVHPQDVLFFDKSVISTILAQFNIAYAYNAESIYEKYLDYSKFDLSKINYSINKFEDVKLKSYDAQLEILKNRMNSVNLEVEDAQKHLNQLLSSIGNNKNNETYLKGKEILTNKLENKKTKYEELKNMCKETSTQKASRENEIRTNEKYYLNKNILTHIRNSLAHGNFEIERFNRQGNLGNAIIHIQDIYMGEISFDSVITMNDFVSLFNNCNYNVLKEMYDDVIKEYRLNNENSEKTKIMQ